MTFDDVYSVLLNLGVVLSFALGFIAGALQS